jgi:uncharacterized protein, YhcH/YjgK/YiaL family
LKWAIKKSKADIYIYASVQEYSTQDATKCKIEAHNEYYDVHVIISGEERVDIYDRTLLETDEIYDQVNDIGFYRQSEKPFASIILKPGQFLFIDTTEAHKVRINSVAEVNVRKVVFKIRKEPSINHSITHLVIDVDGTLTDSGIYYGCRDSELKKIQHQGCCRFFCCKGG